MFKKENWKTSASYMRNVRYLALMALFIAMKTILSGIAIPVSENLKIGISFIIVAIEASILGPVSGMISGFITDIVSFMIFPDGAFFMGYTLTAMCGSLIYALFLYNRKITICNITFAKILNNYLVNVLMGSLWSYMLYGISSGKGYLLYASRSLIKNTILLPIEIIMLVIIFNILIPFLKSRRLISSDNKTPIPLK